MHFLKLYGGGYLAMSKAKQAQLNLRIPPYVAAYTEPYQSVSEKTVYALTGAIAPGEKAEAGDGD